MNNGSEAEKSSTFSDALEHLRVVKMERAQYKAVCEECKESIRAHFVTNGEFTPLPPWSRTPCNSNNIKAHYSFDYAQQVHYPSDPLQPGPIYFLTPRKCTVFGVNCEALPRQINFLTDEAGDCGKGAMLSSVGWTSSFTVMALERRTSFSSPIIALDRTKTTAWCIIWHGGS
jgi:hypothetical protein